MLGLRLNFFLIANHQPKIENLKLFIFFVQLMATATTAKLFQLQPSGRVLFVFRRNVIALFTLGALQNYVISRHNFLPLSLYQL